MEFNSEIISTETYKLSYRYYSGGEKFLFLFHGFGQTSDIFHAFVTTIITNYTVIAVDLFFHGNSEVLQTDNNFISIENWDQLFEKILQKHSIRIFSFLSFSIGSRFVFAALQKYPDRIQRITLIAPDGFGNNFWFRLATSNVLCRAMFKVVLEFPLPILFLGKVFHVFGIIHGTTYRFIKKSLLVKEERDRIYKTWTYFRKLNITQKDFEHVIHTHAIKILFATSEKDELVAHSTIKKISAHVHAEHIELPLAHAKMIQAINVNAVNQFLIADR